MARLDSPLVGRRILVVDDCKDITSLVAEAFASIGARPVEVNNGTEAMMMLLTTEFDVMVLDMVMPHPDGWRVLDFARRRPEWLGRTIIVTAYRYSPQVSAAVGQYGVAHLFKPFMLADLIGAASRVVEQARFESAA